MLGPFGPFNTLSTTGSRPSQIATLTVINLKFALGLMNDSRWIAQAMLLWHFRPHSSVFKSKSVNEWVRYKAIRWPWLKLLDDNGVPCFSHQSRINNGKYPWVIPVPGYERTRILTCCLHSPTLLNPLHSTSHSSSFLTVPVLSNTRRLVSQHYNRSESLQAKLQHKAAYEQKIKLSKRFPLLARLLIFPSSEQKLFSPFFMRNEKDE